MKIDVIKAQLSRVERQRRLLEQRIEGLQRQKLMKLPKQAGFASMDDLILALLDHASPALRARLVQSDNMIAGQGERLPSRVSNGVRGRFEPELKEKIRAELESGQKTVEAISREYGPSHPTIMGWKREWGMTRPHSKRNSNGSGR